MARHPEIYSNARWQGARHAAIVRDNGLCQECMKRGIFKPGTEVHHRVELTDANKGDWDIAYNIDNLVTLCMECHSGIHNGVSTGLTDFLKPVENFQTSAETLPPGSKK